MHILPKHLSRVRYCGILAAYDREERLTLCRKFINESQNSQPNNEMESDAICTLPALQPCELEDEYIEDEPPAPRCQCRYCKGEMELLGRVQGTETQAMRRLSQDVIYKVSATLFAVIRNDTIQQLLSQLRSAWLTTKQLPSSIRHLFRGNRLTSLECGVLEAFVIEELRFRCRSTRTAPIRFLRTRWNLWSESYPPLATLYPP